jgi:hypothetical protein
MVAFLQLIVLQAVAVVLFAFFPVVISVSAMAALYVLGNMTNHLVQSTDTALMRMVYYILPNLGIFNLTTQLGQGKLLSTSYLLLLTAYTIMYCSIVFMIASPFFERRDIR